MAFQGSLKELPLPDIIQLVSVSGKTGVFVLKNEASVGEIFLRDGQIVHADTGQLQGEEAVYELAVWPEGDFVFHPGKQAPTSSIKRSNTNLLMEAARRIDEWQVLSKKIPSTRLVPVFTPEASKTSVSLTPAEWRLVTRIDEHRTIEEVALALDQSPFETCKTLYGLIAAGLVFLDQGLGTENLERLHQMTKEQCRSLVRDIHRQAHQLLASHEARARLEAQLVLGESAVDAGRQVDAITDLVRSEQQIVSAALGPNQSNLFLERVGALIAGI